MLPRRASDRCLTTNRVLGMHQRKFYKIRIILRSGLATGPSINTSKVNRGAAVQLYNCSLDCQYTRYLADIYRRLHSSSSISSSPSS